jgi:hypothetical protein
LRSLSPILSIVLIIGNFYLLGKTPEKRHVTSGNDKRGTNFGDFNRDFIITTRVFRF